LTSETSEPTGFTVLLAIETMDSPRLYMRWAATNPEITVVYMIILLNVLCASTCFLAAICLPWDDPNFYDAKDRHESSAELLPLLQDAFGSFSPYKCAGAYPAGAMMLPRAIAHFFEPRRFDRIEFTHHIACTPARKLK
jgi:hypothetical protein